MTDLEKVIRGLEVCAATGRSCDGCPYFEPFETIRCYHQMMEDALALLKEHEKPDCEHAEHDDIGCLGYAGCAQDDEPINVCKSCREYTGNRYEEVSEDA